MEMQYFPFIQNTIYQSANIFTEYLSVWTNFTDLDLACWGLKLEIIHRRSVIPGIIFYIYLKTLFLADRTRLTKLNSVLKGQV